MSLLALGDVASLKTLMATGIFTSSPSGTHMPCVNTYYNIYIVYFKSLYLMFISYYNLGCATPLYVFYSLLYTKLKTFYKMQLIHLNSLYLYNRCQVKL